MSRSAIGGLGCLGAIGGLLAVSTFVGDMIDHYDGVFRLSLTRQEKNDLVEFLKSL